MRRDISWTSRVVHSLRELSAREVDRQAGSAVSVVGGAGNRLARKLKTYQTSLGFFDLAIAAAVDEGGFGSWGADSNLFHQGAAKESDDPDVVAATMCKAGRRSQAPRRIRRVFGEQAALPTNLGGGEGPRND